MKKIILLLILALGAFSITAQNSSVTIFSDDGKPFYLFLNNVRQNKTPELNIRVDNLMNEYYDTKIVFEDERWPDLQKKTLMVRDVDGNFGNATYKIKATRKGKLVIRHYSFTPYTPAPIVQDNVTVIQYNTVPLPAISTTTTTTTQTTTGTGTNDNVNVGVNIGGVSIGMDVNINEGNGINTSTSTTTTTTTTTGIATGTDVAIIEDTVDCYTLTDSDFNEALASIEGKTFADSKLTLAKQVAKNNCLTAKQIKKIVLLFTFESNKLEFAKFAYPYCFNPENYWKINDAFEFESSIDELNSFIERR